jgi:hypothetical protein
MLSASAGVTGVSFVRADGAVSVIGADAAPRILGRVASEKVRAFAAQAGHGLVVTDTNSFYTIAAGSAPRDLCAGSTLCPQELSFSAVALNDEAQYGLAAIGASVPGLLPPPAEGYGVLVADLSTGALRLDRSGEGNVQQPITSIVFVPGSTSYFAAAVDGNVFRGDAEGGGLKTMAVKADSPIWALTIAPDGKTLAIAMESGAVLLARVSADGVSALASLYVFDDGDWCVVRPEGQYDASNGGHMDGILWMYGSTAVHLDQMLPKSYRADLLPRLLGFKDIAIESSPSLDRFHPDLPPSIHIVSVDAGTGEVEFALDPEDAIIGGVKAYLNGSWVQGENIRATSTRGHYRVSIAGHHAIAASNELEIVIANAASSVDSRGFRQEVSAAAAPAQQPAQFYAIVAGISDFPGASGLHSLPLANDDALEMARDVAIGARNLVGDPARVHLVLLTSDRRRGEAPSAALR